MKRSEIRKKNRKGIKFTLIAVALLFAMGIVYWIVQYNNGLSLAGKSLTKGEESGFDAFEGPDPVFGEINVLLMGSDARGDENPRSDTLMIAHYNQTTHDVRTCFPLCGTSTWTSRTMENRESIVLLS